MSYELRKRAPQSFQAPHRPLKSFPVHADSKWNRESNTVSVIVRPKDAVTYSLTTGEVLGTVGILKLMLADAKAPGLTGTILNFSVPADMSAPSAFTAPFNTSNRHVCWFDGEATLRVIAKRIGKSLPLSEEEAKQLEIETPPKSPNEGQTAEADQGPAEPPATPEASANEQADSAQ